MKRRNFIKSTITTGLLAGLYTWQVEPYWLEIVWQKMPIRNLPKNLIGKRLMQISDIHVGDDFDLNFLVESFAEAKKYKPDFVVYTGDYISYINAERYKQLRNVMQLAPHGTKGTYAILGNHDYGHRWSQPKVANKISNLLSAAGITMLRNEKQQSHGLNFIGIDDLWGTNFKPKKVMKTIDQDAANLVLCHNPDVCDLNVWYKYKGWILSGHTHGGQCKAPFLTPPILPVKNKNYSAGYVDLKDGRHLYINRALGHSMQVRFNVRPEITIFELSQAV